MVGASEESMCRSSETVKPPAYVQHTVQVPIQLPTTVRTVGAAGRSVEAGQLGQGDNIVERVDCCTITVRGVVVNGPLVNESCGERKQSNI